MGLDRSVEGRRLRLTYTNDPYTNLRYGDEGTAGFIDDMGTVSVKWDNGSTLGLVPGTDQWDWIDP